MSSTLLVTDPLFLEHLTGEGHPERPERLASILKFLEAHPVKGTQVVKPRPATVEELASAHAPAHLASLRSVMGQSVMLDPDTPTSPRSYEAAVLAAGAGVTAAEAMFKGQARNAFALVRPPGHHAEPDRAMGFCLFSNAAVVANAARQLGAKKVAIVDWDVHHGNGTQACFADRTDVLFISLHQFGWGFYPGTGAHSEIGSGPGAGFTVNCPLPSGQTDASYGAAFELLVLPILRAYAPDFVIVSAGFDAHRRDPLGEMGLTEKGFAAMCSSLRTFADSACGGRLLLLLEGGYDLDALSRSVHACVEVLAGGEERFSPGPVSGGAADAIRNVQAMLLPFWPSLS